MSKTLDNLRTELQTRLGFAASGSVSFRNKPIIESFINQAYEEVYRQYADYKLVTENVIPIGLGQEYVDLPADVDVTRRLEVHLRIPGEYNDRTLTRGLPENLRENTAYPPHGHVVTPNYNAINYPNWYTNNYDIEDGKIRLFPVPDQDNWYLRLNYIKALQELTQGTDTIDLDYQSVFLLSLANAKAHYNQQDATAIGRQYEARIKKIRASEHDGMRYVNSTANWVPAPRPRDA